MKNYCGLILLFLSLPFTVAAQKLRVAVAANAQFVAKVLAAEFKKTNGIDADLIIGSSGKLTTQIEQGAPFDVFMSADMKYPRELHQKKLTTAPPKIYAYGTLVLWSKNTDLSKRLAALSGSSVRKIAIANPTLAPYGEAAEQAMKKSGLLSKLKSKFVYGESIAQVNQYLLSGAADVVFTAQSVVLDPAQKDVGTWIAVNPKLYQPIAQGMVVLKSAKGINRTNAVKFYQFLLGKKAKEIFTTYGYK